MSKASLYVPYSGFGGETPNATHFHFTRFIDQIIPCIMDRNQVFMTKRMAEMQELIDNPLPSLHYRDFRVVADEMRAKMRTDPKTRVRLWSRDAIQLRSGATVRKLYGT